MKISKTSWITLLLLGIISAGVWRSLSYPQLAIVDYTINRPQALQIAKSYLIEKQRLDPSQFKTAIVFSSDVSTNRYLQKAIGFPKFKEFLDEHDFDLFFWIVRFFQENKKEEYRVIISSATGEVTSYSHTIDDNASRPHIERDVAQERSIQFLRKTFGFNPDLYAIKADLSQELDNRTDYNFSWQKKSVNIPWSPKPNTGTGKLLINAKISGDEILSFSKNAFDVPDEFNRYLDQKKDVGESLITIIRIFYILLFIGAIYFVLAKYNHLSMHK